MKKVIKATLVFVLLLYPFLYTSQLFFLTFFNFQVLSPNDWQYIGLFLEKGGVIKTTKDLMLLVCLGFNPIIFLILWRLLYKKSFINLILYPINIYNRRVIAKYGQNSKRIVLKNICRSTDKKQEINELKPDLSASKQASQSIREAVREKLTNN